MARLPTPVTEALSATYDEDYQASEKGLYKIIGKAIRNAGIKEKMKGSEEADETN